MIRPHALRGPHLMLADIGRHDRVARCDREEPIHDGRGRKAVDFVARRRCPHTGYFIAPIVEARNTRAFEFVAERAQRCSQIAGQRHVGGDDLREFARIDIGVDDRRVAGEAIGAAGHAIIETHAQRQDDVGTMDREIRGFRTVHAEHAQIMAIAWFARA